MKYIYSLLILISIQANSQVSQQWAARYNGLGDYSDKVTCMAKDPSGNLYLGGYSTKSGNQKDFLVLKLNINGDTLWSRTFDGTNHGHDEALAIAYDANGFVYATGYFEQNNTGNDIFIIKLDVLGDSIWSRTYNYTANQDEQGNAIAVDASGNVVVTGQSDNDPSAATNDDYVTLRYTSVGIQSYILRYNGAGLGTDRATSVLIQANGNAVVTGRSFIGDDDFMTISYTSAGAVAWSVGMDGGQGNDRAVKIVQDASGNLFVAGQSTNGTDYDYAVAMYNSTGTVQWVSFYDNIPGNDYPTSLAIDNAGHILVTGRCDADPSAIVSNDLVTVSYDISGNQLWVATYNGSGNGNDEGADIATDAAGNSYVTGRSDINPSLAITDYDMVTVSYDVNGTQRWANLNGAVNSLNDGGVAILTNSANDCITTGNVVNTGSAKDIRSIHYSNAGISQWQKEFGGLGDHNDGVNAMTADAFGNSYMAGYTYSPSNKRDMCVAKINSIGDTVWVRTIDGAQHSDDEANAVVVDGSGNVFITGFAKDTITGNNYCTAKFSSAGALLWVTKYNYATANGTDRALAMVINAAGEIIVTGQSDADASAVSNYDITTIKYNSAGVQQWIVRTNGAGNLSDIPSDMSINNNGDVVVVGKSGVTATDDDAFIEKILANGTLAWSTHVHNTLGNDNVTAVAQDPYGNIAVAIQNTNASLTDDINVWYSDANGNNWWTGVFNGTGNGNDRPAGITFDGSGNIFVTGETDADTASANSNYDIVTLKYNSNGILQWSKTYDGIAGDDDNGVDVAVDNVTGYAYVTGQCNNGSIATKNNDIVILQYDAAGNQQLVGTYNGGSAEGPDGIVIRGNNVYVAGSSVGSGNNQKDMIMLLYTAFNVSVPTQVLSNDLSVFPNPCHESTTLQFDNSSINRKVIIVDMNGRELFNENTNSSSLKISTEVFAKGMYLGTVITNGNSIEHFKIIVE